MCQSGSPISPTSFSIVIYTAGGFSNLKIDRLHLFVYRMFTLVYESSSEDCWEDRGLENFQHNINLRLQAIFGLLSANCFPFASLSISPLWGQWCCCCCWRWRWRWWWWLCWGTRQEGPGCPVWPVPSGAAGEGRPSLFTYWPHSTISTTLQFLKLYNFYISSPTLQCQPRYNFYVSTEWLPITIYILAPLYNFFNSTISTTLQLLCFYILVAHHYLHIGPLHNF